MAPPTKKVRAITRWTGTPINDAVSGSWATARIAVADARAVNKEMERGEHRQGRADNQNRFHRDHQAGAKRHREIENFQGRIGQIKSIAPQAFEQTQAVLQQKRSADRRDQRHQPRAAEKRPISDSFKGHRRQAADGHAGNNDKRQYQGRVQRRQVAAALQRQKNLAADKGAQHKDFAMGKIDELEDAIDHRITECDQGVHEAQYQAIDQHLGKNFESDFQTVGTFKVRYANRTLPEWLPIERFKLQSSRQNGAPPQPRTLTQP